MKSLALALALLPLVAQAKPAARQEVALWPQGAPGSEGKTAPEVVLETDGVRRVSTIHNPSITVYLPPKKKGTGAAAIILPGGGHRYLAIDNEGHQVATRLAADGVAGFVLKYRLAREPGSTYTVAEHALADTHRALRLVRSRAKEWGLDPARVGVIGFSAGGQLATYAGARWDTGKPDAADPIERESARPAFQGIVYAGAVPPEVAVPKDPPPAFILTAADDKGPTTTALALFQKLREAGAEAELHVYGRGGHGFGMKDRPMPVTAWPARFLEWLGDRGMLKAAPPPRAASREEQALDRTFAATVRPFVDRYCADCHGAKPKGDLDLRPYTGLASVVAGFPRWAEVLDQLKSGDMPPAKGKTPAKLQPTPAERQAVIAWIEAVRTGEARRHAGDPGPVPPRRLSNAEYDNTIRDLTGADIRPAREFPVDPTNPAGFDNSGESLAMSPALMKKYLQAARKVASHLVLETEGIAFASHPMLVETDRDKYCVQKIVDFYRRQNTDLAAYFQVAWRFKHRAALGTPNVTLAALAATHGVSPKYLATLWRTLEETRETMGPLARLQAAWRKLPAARRGQPAPQAAFAALRDEVLAVRKKLEPRFDPPSVEGIPDTAQPFAMWRNRQYAGHRMKCDRGALPADGAGHEEAFDRFCAVFPDAFYIAERGRTYGNTTREKGRLLSAGFHNVMGYFRDDQPLYQLLLDPGQQAELDRLWHELDFVAAATSRTYVQFYSNGAGAVMARQAGASAPVKEITSAPAIARLKTLYLGRLPAGAAPVATAAINQHFESVDATLRWVERARAAAEPKHLESLLAFAARAYRRPLTFPERDGLLAYYRGLRKDLDHEEAMRDAVVMVLMSPDFCYRIDRPRPETTGPGALPLSDHALASRLSYFLWSTMPDAELLARAQAGDLRRPEVLAAQARRMLKDPRARGLATEFGGGWLDFRRFEEHNAVDRQRFRAFDDQLRAAMYEEPVRFLLDLIQSNRSVLDLVQGKHTFVNAPLARHYGLAVPQGIGDGWWRADHAAARGRGGILPMAVFLTKNAPGLRTSPVKRGYWVVKNVLGERIPPPPPVVPELPSDEASLELPLREHLAQHRENPACAGCHARFDSLGLVFEGYGPIGEVRTKDLAGRPVDARAQFPNDSEGTGLEGLRQYLRAHRQRDFLDNFTRKLLAYALGRSLMLSDDATVADLQARLARGGHRFQTLVEGIVTSPQFLNKRAPERLAAR